MKMRKREFLAGAAVGVVLAGTAAAGMTAHWPASRTFPHGGQLIRTSGPAVFAPPPGAPESFADIFDRVSGAVVSIDVKTHVDAATLRRIPGFENFPFDATPKTPGGKTPPSPKGRGGQPTDPDEDAPEQLASGSGFFISPDGYIVTNNHVVENADDITITLKDKRELKGTIVGRDEATDLAVIKVAGAGFPFVSFETQNRPRVGDWVFAVGNPFGLGGTATAGIVSAYGRALPGEQWNDFIQIDAPINRGNSGGPTFDIYGRVIGVNTAIFSPNGYSVGIGFAIPSDVADSITKQLIAGGKISRGYVGVTIGNVTDDIVASLNLKDKTGAYVTQVTRGGPAEQGGVQPGDIVTSLNGQAVDGSADLTRKVAAAKVGDVLRLSVLRNGKIVNLEVHAGLRPSEAELNRQNGGDDDDSSTPNSPAAGPEVVGLSVAPLDAAARRKFALDAGLQGLVVTGIAPHTDAAKKGLHPGDVVLRADNTPVATVAEFQAIAARLKAAGRPSILLLINRNGQNAPVALDLK